MHDRDRKADEAGRTTRDGRSNLDAPEDPDGRDARVGVARRFWRSLQEDDVAGLSAEMAFRFLFAVFPFGLFVAALGSFVAAALSVDNPAQQIIASLGDNLPESVAGALRQELGRLVSSPRADLLSLGAIVALWAATSGTNALMKGINRAYDAPESRPLVLRYAVAIGLTLLGAVGVIGSFVTIVGGALVTQELAVSLGIGSAAFEVLELLRWPAVALVLIVAVSILYRYAPIVVVPWRWVVLGSVAFTVGWLVATGILGLYVAGFANYGATYGSLAGVVVLMLWFYVTAALLLLGAELTAAVARERSPHEITLRRTEAGEAAEEAEVAGGATDAATRSSSGDDRKARPPRLDRPAP